MANTIMPTYFSSGVRRLSPGLGYWSVMGALGDVNDTANGMISEGYDPGIVNSLVAMGATDAQLQNLWDTTAANSPDFSNGAQMLLMQLSGLGTTPVPPMPTSAAGAAYGAVSTIIQYGNQALDLTQHSSWDFLNQQFQFAQQQLNALAQQLPSDQTVIAQQQNLSSLMNQFGTYYTQVMTPTPVSLSGWLTLQGLGQISVTGVLYAVSAIASIATALYALIQWIAAKKIQYTAAQTQAGAAQTQATTAAATIPTLTNQYAQLMAQQQAAQAAGNTVLAAQLKSQSDAVLAAIVKLGGTVPGTQPPGAINFSTWFQQNWGWLMIGLGTIIIVPAALRRR